MKNLRVAPVLLQLRERHIIDNAYIIYRRFPEIVQTLSALGAKISKA